MTTTNDTRDQLLTNVRSIAADLERLVRLQFLEDATDEDFAWLATQEIENADDDGIWTRLWEWPLEVIQHATKRSYLGEDAWEYSHSVVVFSTGGPHIELDTKLKLVQGYWGGDHVRWGVSDDVCNFFEED